MDHKARRARIAEGMGEDSILVLYSGVTLHSSADAGHPFEENKHFFYLTGLRRENMALVMMKRAGKVTETLFIEEADAFSERWTGKMVRPDEAKAVSGVEDVRYIDALDAWISRIAGAYDLREAWFDCFRMAGTSFPDYNLMKAQEFTKNYPAVPLRNLHPAVSRLRMQKDADEVREIQSAVDKTEAALEHVMANLRPGMREYQAQALFEYKIRDLGAEKPSFPTIAGSGMNGTMMHYETNLDVCEDGTLLLLDLGARVNGYCSDITRTYPVNGRFTERQRSLYEIVLRANRAVKEAAKPGLTLRDLNDRCKEVLSEGLIALGLIKDASEVGKYYMHSVSHHLGIDVHDVTVPDVVLLPGAVITDEPGLYVDEWAIGIRIEDDLLITEDGCVCLSESVIRDPDEIEAFMAQ